MKNTLAIVCLVILSVNFASAQYIGYEYKGVTPESVLPNGVKHLGGGLISDVNADPLYGVAQVSKGKTRMLWLEVSTGQDAGGVTGWRVLDVLSLPAPTATRYVMLPFDPVVECRRNGGAAANLIAVGRLDGRRSRFTAERAWTVDIAKKKFVPAAAGGLRCIYSEP